MELTIDEQIRIAALNAAITYLNGSDNPYAGNMANIEMYADAFQSYIRTGEMPKPPAGVI